MSDATHAGRDLVLRAGVENPAIGDIVMETGGVERGRITSDGRALGIIGGAAVLFDQTVVGAPALQLDTGPIIPAGFAALECFVICRSTYVTAITTGGVGIRCNGDAGNNYTYDGLLDANGVYGGASNATAPESTWRINVPGTTIVDSAVATIARFWIPFYDNAQFYKMAVQEAGVTDTVTAANSRSRVAHCQWKSTAPINQLTLIAQTGGGALDVGTRFLVAGIRG